MKYIRSNPILTDENGRIEEIDLASDAANSDWLRAARLVNSNINKDKEKLEELENTPTQKVKFE